MGFAAPSIAAQKPEANQPAPAKAYAAYYDGQVVSFVPDVIHYRFTPRPLRHRQRDLTIGPWYFGSLLVNRKPKDSRHNFYIVSPGTQYHRDGAEEYDHNDIISELPKDDKPIEWDIYWAIVLDPALHGDFHSERDLILAAQESFVPSDLMEFEDIPGEAFVRTFLHIDSVEGLTNYRRTDGTLPRLLIVPANSVILGSVVVPENSDPALLSEHSSDLGKH